MSENRFSCGGSSPGRDTVCIDTYRVLDSCRDRDCFENVRVYVNDFGQEIINRTANVRAKRTELCGAYVGVEPIAFNRGFYSILCRIFVRCTMEGCVCPGRPQEFEGVAVVEKKVILYGSEGNVNIYRSTCNQSFCQSMEPDENNCSSNLPVAVLETVEPVILGSRVVEPRTPCNCYCCCSCEEIPTNVLSAGQGTLSDSPEQNKLFVSLGLFSVIRIERPAQLLVSAREYSVPDKECVTADDEDPCSLFRSMAFPTQQFSPPGLSSLNYQEEPSCGCKGK